MSEAERSDSDSSIRSDLERLGAAERSDAERNDSDAGASPPSSSRSLCGALALYPGEPLGDFLRGWSVSRRWCAAFEFRTAGSFSHFLKRAKQAKGHHFGKIRRVEELLDGVGDVEELRGTWAGAFAGEFVAPIGPPPPPRDRGRGKAPGAPKKSAAKLPAARVEAPKLPAGVLYRVGELAGCPLVDMMADNEQPTGGAGGCETVGNGEGDPPPLLTVSHVSALGFWRQYAERQPGSRAMFALGGRAGPRRLYRLAAMRQATEPGGSRPILVRADRADKFAGILADLRAPAE